MPILYEHVFSKSPERVVTVAKKPTSLVIDLLNEGKTASIKDTTQWVGTPFVVYGSLWSSATGAYVKDKTVRLMKRVNTGAWTEIAKVSTGTSGIFEWKGTLSPAGTHTYQWIFDGDDEYEGCAKAVRLFAR